MNREELLKKYHAYYGNDAPIPPDHLLPVIIEMKESGEMDRIHKEHKEKLDSVIKEIGLEGLDKNDPFWRPIPDQNKTQDE